MRWGLLVVHGRSMLPTLREGDRLLARYDAVPRAGDLVVVRLPGAPGEPVPRRLAVKRALRREPAGWWVERDNPAEGVDSWLVGAIPDVDVVAVVRLRWGWPRRGTGRRPVPD